MVNITWTQLQMIVVCMIVLIALAVWISRRRIRTSQTPTIRSSNNPPVRGPRGRALSAGYPLRARSVSSERSRSRSSDDPRVQAYIQNPRAKAYRQRAQEHLRRRRPSRERELSSIQLILLYTTRELRKLLNLNLRLTLEGKRNESWRTESRTPISSFNSSLEQMHNDNGISHP